MEKPPLHRIVFEKAIRLISFRARYFSWPVTASLRPRSMDPVWQGFVAGMSVPSLLILKGEQI
jgi:hypothetical protein